MIPAVCKPIENQVAGLISERELLQEQLGEAPPSQKPAILAAIKHKDQQIAAKKKALNKCVSPHTLVSMSDWVYQILDWSLDGSWRLWNYDPTKADILSGSPAKGGTWSSIHDGHVLISMPLPPFDEALKVLDWVPATGAWRLWNYNRNASDVLPTLARQGKWATIRTGHVLLPVTSPGPGGVGANHVLDWVPATGDWRLWEYRPDAVDILPGPAVKKGQWSTIKSDHVLVQMDDGKILDWVPGQGSWRLWNYDPDAVDILPGPAVKKGQWSTIKSDHVLVHMPDGKILDWVPGQGSWRLWNYDPDAVDILPGPAVKKGQWNTIH